ncbi:UDP-glucose 4-epimerase GalE [Brumimicrobium salinarum]|uniref:UDP-glucose 4-epimerase n=1 Tax=Brumimicrobium salinarum TaxID=2058658 RepID=A0A2I0R5S9_9FLAO|nr:UDP-glucose 4-epimerase GalE [Brumimicrobium salinarum]PKR81937.1 UDP-glucose 4-epimerase GalE [Brumimicrobium salinarum]
MNTKNRYILVTGGAGYIGSHTVLALINNGYTPIIIDDFRNAHKDVIFRLEELTAQEIIYFSVACQDEFRLKGVFEQFHIEGVIHFAADKAVGESTQKPLKYFDNNFGSLISVLELVQQYKVENFVFSSSCTVYGDPKTIPVVEKSPVSYNSPYGFTKKVNEEMIAQFVESAPFVQATILRYFNPIGAHESGKIGEEPDGKPNNLLPFITQTAFGIREELTVFGDDYDTKDGTCIRDYIHVEDLAEAHVAALSKANEAKQNPEIYNIGTGKGTSVLEMIQVFEKVTGQQLPYSIGERRSGDIPEIYANADKANKILNWKAQKSIEEAVKSAWKFENFIREKRKSK